MQDFYPRSPCGERHVNLMFAKSLFSISIHALLAESDQIAPASPTREGRFLSTLSLRRATDTAVRSAQNFQISIHALLAESDYIGKRNEEIKQFISIHALLAESDRHLHACLHHYGRDFYPRSPCGERLEKIRRGKAGAQFLSTLSLRRAT